jgi:hypothetical protein
VVAAVEEEEVAVAVGLLVLPEPLLQWLRINAQ